MLKGIDIDKRIPFTPSADVTEPKTVFILKPLTGLDMLGFSEMVVDGKLSMKGDNILDYIDKSIERIENFNNEGEIISGPHVKDVIRKMPIDILTELMTEIGNINNLTKDEEKNS